LQQESIARERETPIDTGQQYSLPELVDMAERYNPATRVAWEAAKARAGQFEIARGDLLPTLSAVTLAETSRQGVLFGSTFVRQTLGLYEPLLRVNYLIFDFGERTSRIETARD
jgi:outer membrane protein TolC